MYSSFYVDLTMEKEATLAPLSEVSSWLGPIFICDIVPAFEINESRNELDTKQKDKISGSFRIIEECN